MVESVPSLALLLHQVSAPQQSQVFGDGRPRDRKLVRNLSGRLTAAPQQVEYGSATNDARVSNRVKPWIASSRFQRVREMPGALGDRRLVPDGRLPP